MRASLCCPRCVAWLAGMAGLPSSYRSLPYTMCCGVCMCVLFVVCLLLIVCCGGLIERCRTAAGCLLALSPAHTILYNPLCPLPTQAKPSLLSSQECNSGHHLC